MGRPPKLTPHQQREAIRRRDRGGESLADIGRSYNVSGGDDFPASSGASGKRRAAISVPNRCSMAASCWSTAATHRSRTSQRDDACGLATQRQTALLVLALTRLGNLFPITYILHPRETISASTLYLCAQR
jgi:hypothetical protein